MRGAEQAPEPEAGEQAVGRRLRLVGADPEADPGCRQLLERRHHARIDLARTHRQPHVTAQEFGEQRVEIDPSVVPRPRRAGRAPAEPGSHRRSSAVPLPDRGRAGRVSANISLTRAHRSGALSTRVPSRSNTTASNRSAKGFVPAMPGGCHALNTQQFPEGKVPPAIRIAFCSEVETICLLRSASSCSPPARVRGCAPTGRRCFIPWPVARCSRTCSRRRRRWRLRARSWSWRRARTGSRPRSTGRALPAVIIQSGAAARHRPCA